MYNALGSGTSTDTSSSTGDELYGTEPASYYVKNLFLNTGFAWVLTLAAPATHLLCWAVNVNANASKTEKKYSGSGSSEDADNAAAGESTTATTTVVLHLQALLWLAVLFSRPHKVSCLGNKITDSFLELQLFLTRHNCYCHLK